MYQYEIKSMDYKGGVWFSYATAEEMTETLTYLEKNGYAVVSVIPQWIDKTED